MSETHTRTGLTGSTTPAAAPHVLRPGLLIVGILLVAANMRAGITVVGPLLGDVRSELHISAAAASALISLPVLCFAVFSPITPPIAARKISSEWVRGRATDASRRRCPLPGDMGRTFLVVIAIAHERSRIVDRKMMWTPR